MLINLLRWTSALAAIVLVALFVAAIVSARGADLFDRFALSLRGLAGQLGAFRLGDTPVLLEPDSGGGGDGGDGGAGDGGDGAGDGAGGDGGDSGSLLADAQAAIESLRTAGAEIPEALTKAVNELKQARQDAARYRTDRNDVSSKMATLEAQFGKIAKHLGLEDDDPTKIAEAAQAERDRLAAEVKSLKLATALGTAAKAHGADVDLLGDSRTFMEAASKLDPADDKFAEALAAEVKKAVEANPKLKATQAASRSGPQFNGDGSNGNGDHPKSLQDAVAAHYGS